MKSYTDEYIRKIEIAQTEEEADFALDMAVLTKLWNETIEQMNKDERDQRILDEFAKMVDAEPGSPIVHLFEMFSLGVNAGIGFALKLTTPPASEQE